MSFAARAGLGVVALSLIFGIAAGCGSPTSPSSVRPGAVIAGSVSAPGAAGAGQGAGGSVSAPANSLFMGLTVRVMGTDLSAVVGAAGTFEIPGVPAGNARLQFRNDVVNATADLANVRTDQYINLRVELSAASAVVVGDERTQKVSICHKEGTGDYHLIDISESAEGAHRDHGDAKIGEDVPGQPGKTFDSNCRPVGPSIDIEKLTNGEDADTPPGPSITIGSQVNWRYVVRNTGTVNLTAIAVVDDRGVTVSCPGTSLAPSASMTCTAQGIASQMGQYRNLGTVTANWSNAGATGTVTDSDPSHYLGISPIEIKKFTNGEDADTPPGPSIQVGSQVTWEYRLTNIGTVNLTGIQVTDNRGVAVSCMGPATLGPGVSTTCTAQGTAVAGQYSNIGTVTASWAAGGLTGTVTDSDPSHYRGVTDDEDDGQKVNLCHRTGAGFYVLINVSVNAEPAHRAHGDAAPGQGVPGSPGRTFGANCSVQ
jgi:hypothetical protein